MAERTPDISGKITVDATSFSSPDTYELTNSGPKPLVLHGFAVHGDSNFYDSGKLRGYLKGRPLTSQGSNPNSGVTLSDALIINFDRPFLPVIEPGQSVRFEFVMTSGTGTVNVLVDVTQLSAAELERWRAAGVVA